MYGVKAGGEVCDYLFSRGEFGILGDKDKYYHLEPLDKEDPSVRGGVRGLYKGRG